ncbi:MAG: exodeoxyribonuclease III [Balneolaceae bacterium]|nr:exodeoxyribonuclease III [Balneolaceae bacterium]
MLKISSYNVNGIRAAHRKGFTDWVAESNPDIICIQELRATEEQIPREIKDLGYHEFYHDAEKKGYSGVAILSRIEPQKIVRGMGVEWVDNEGRIIMAEYDKFRLFSVYAPSGTTGDVRQDMKMSFLDDFIRLGQDLVADEKPTLFCGDINICHKAIDIHNPKRNKNTSGFLPEEREWVSSFLDKGYRDVFRELHPDKTDLYSWWSYRAASKERNKGWRIDYHLATDDLMAKANHAEIERKWDLSDHAPVSVSYNID